MNAKTFLFPLLLICSALTLTLRRSVKPTSAKSDSTRSSYDVIDAYIKEEMRRLKIPGVSLAIVEGDQIVHVRGFGRDRPDGTAPTPQTPFLLGSVTKSFTALAVMQLVEAGKVELDAPIQRYLPWFRVADPKASAQMTVRHLLNQTSGLPALSGEIILADFDNSPDATERQARALRTVVLGHPAGSAFEYSNSNYGLLGLIIEAVSGEAYADYVQKHIFTPLDMGHSYASPAVAKQNGLAVGHQYLFGIPFAVPNMPAPLGALPGGALISTSEDMARFMIAHLNGGRYGDVQILSSAGIDELQRGVVEYHNIGISMKYGMGWFVSDIGQKKIAWHSGTLPDFFAYMGLFPGQKKGLILLFNACHHWYNPILTEAASGAAALLAGEQPTPVPFIRLMPWMLRAQLLIPVLQMAGVATTLGLLRRWRLDPERRPSGRRKWGLRILLPLIPNLLLALTLRPMLSKRRGYLRLYMPDYSWIARICGSFALAWSFLRTGLVLRVLRNRHTF